MSQTDADKFFNRYTEDLPDDSIIKERYNFHGSFLDGRFNSFYKRGSLKSDLVYSNNQLAGSCSWYYPNGNIMKIKEFLGDENYQHEFYHKRI